MNKELAKTLTLALINYIDENRPEGTMDCSSGECVSLEKAFTEENFDSVEGFIQKKLSRLTEFEKALAELVNDVLTKEPQNPAVWIVGSGWTDKLFSLAREQFIKDGYVIEKKAFHDAVEKVDPEVMKEVSENVDKMKEGLTELDQCLLDYANERDEYEYDPTNVAELNEKIIDLTKFYANVLRTIVKKELLIDGWNKVFYEEVKTACTNKCYSSSDFDKFLDSSNN